MQTSLTEDYIVLNLQLVSFSKLYNRKSRSSLYWKIFVIQENNDRIYRIHIKFGSYTFSIYGSSDMGISFDTPKESIWKKTTSLFSLHHRVKRKRVCGVCLCIPSCSHQLHGRETFLRASLSCLYFSDPISNTTTNRLTYNITFTLSVWTWYCERFHH